MAIDVPPLDDPSHNAVRGELARLLVLHKADLGAGHFSDAAIVAHVDDVAAVVLARFLLGPRAVRREVAGTGRRARQAASRPAGREA